MGSSPRVRGKLPRPDRRVRSHRLIPARAGKTWPVTVPAFGVQAHPRACGENLPASPPAAPGGGSSPRGRGKHAPATPSNDTSGLIPARAGKTGGSVCRSASPAAHPRACGENSSEKQAGRGEQGSSPRVRGKLVGMLDANRSGGLIPARAGKTLRRARGMCVPWAHPRACGENVKAKLVDWVTAAHPRACGENLHLVTVDEAWAGSSPRVRGKPHRADRGRPRTRLIPARAGKTPGSRLRLRCSRPHPRACGENSSSLRAWRRARGSSPRVRGKHHLRPVKDASLRLIPARAGKTQGAVGAEGQGEAHPRACGENMVGPLKGTPGRGSSPRVRGKPIRHRPPPARRRLIPARAGKTSSRSTPMTRMPAHPRACGENLPQQGQRMPWVGSSPRVRGKRAVVITNVFQARLIPARAGKT